MGDGGRGPERPDWFRNLRAAARVDVQVRDRHLVARPRVLEGEELDRTWREVVLARAPEVRRYAERAGRTVPVAYLVPVPGG